MAARLGQIDEARVWLAGIISGLDVHYDLGDGHPLLGRRMPDLDLTITGTSTAEGTSRVYELMREGRPLLINLGAPGRLDLGYWEDRVRLVEASYAGRWELPVIGTVDAPTAVLVRPDGYVAWVEQSESGPGLTDALSTWFGSPAASLT